MTRTERTRHLIELGGLVVKAGLVDAFDDDRTALYGALLAVVSSSKQRPELVDHWKRRGKAEFDAEDARVR